MKGGVWLSDGEWAAVNELLTKQKRRKDGKGRPRRDPKEVLNGIIYILFSGAPWHLLPHDYPPYQTCHRYFQMGIQAGVFRKILARLIAYHNGRSKGKPTAYIDGSFATAKRGVRV
ncbi:Putative transposase of IS4/5 family [Cnuella takakiae]|uniref:Putative transposase of IS4/5 family n=1 Tax=Cnuella takakiae TaxID=1302690 RepID=A0A1M4SUE5_9BACT|nr:transposase [Cnuella takakiae]SHE35821.1 Putative transposase of IS4/5 family [Cnuella takakiae]